MERDIFFNEINLIKNRDYFNSMDRILTCLICQGFLINPLTCNSCENSCCRECLSTWDKNKEGRALCPNRCSKPLFRDRNKAIGDMLEALKIACVRCSIEVKYQDLVNHVKVTCEKIEVKDADLFNLVKESCRNIEINCDNLGCSKKMKREEMSNHILKCEFLTKDCEECGNPTMDKYSNKVIENLRVENEKFKNFAFEIIDDIFSQIDKITSQKFNATKLDQLNKRIKNFGSFLSSDQIKNIYDKLLNYYFKKIDNNDSVIRLLNTLLQTHKEIFESNKNLSEELLGKLYKVYSFNQTSDDDLPKASEFLHLIIYHLGKYIPWSTVNITQIVKTKLRLLEHNNPKVRNLSSFILGNLSYYCNSEFNVHLVDILNSLGNSINYKDEGQDKELWECARDWAIWALGITIKNRNEQINSSEWIPKWLSYFPLEPGIKLKYSYKAVCLFLKVKPQLLFGINNENLPIIIKILIKVYMDDIIKIRDQLSLNAINSIFEKINNDANLHEYVKIAKANSEGRILEKLNELFLNI